ncbi:MAG TPA: DUF1800 domain-containing protein [Flavobacterium sp.]|jgi:uncharacterized protein (DUF1800 family)
MENNVTWSLRLGFSGKQSADIAKLGIRQFLERSFSSEVDRAMPAFLQDDPKTMAELKAFRIEIKDLSSEKSKKALKKQIYDAAELKAWWIDKMLSEEFPLREKMTCFWHNHFVASSQKVKLNYWVYQHNMILRDNAFGNFKDITKKMVTSNAIVRYLDNVDNRNGKINENLSREMLELFTLGIGNYSEDDIKNGAKGLAGLAIGENHAVYRPVFEDNSTITYFGKTGKFKADELVDIVFEQPEVPYLLTRKILKWFIYDRPDEKLVRYYGDYFRSINFEIKPLLTKIFLEEYDKKTAGSKIKDPLVYIFQLMDELNTDTRNSKLITFFLKQQGMDLFTQPNVKGWDGGNSWLTSQIYLQRQNVADLLCNGKNLNRQKMKMEVQNDQPISVKLKWNNTGTNRDIIEELKNRLLYNVDAATQSDFEKILKYDFEPKSPGAENAVLRLFNAMTKLPEYQLI